jgi:SEC-C motif
MTSILDIDLDYFRFFNDPLERLTDLLGWANRPVDRIVVHHHESLKYWIHAIHERSLAAPRFILHVDEHHDMLGERKPIGFGNYLYFAMRQWSNCRVHWQVNQPIDSPRMWLSDTAWKSVARRFSFGQDGRPDWPKPDIVTVCKSPGFLGKPLSRQLLGRVREHTADAPCPCGSGKKFKKCCLKKQGLSPLD